MDAEKIESQKSQNDSQSERERDERMTEVKRRYQNIGDLGNVCARVNMCASVNKFCCVEKCAEKSTKPTWNVTA